MESFWVHSFDQWNCKKLGFKNRLIGRRRQFILTPPKSANPLIPSVSAKDSSVDICSSNTFTSPEYMNVSSATTAPNDAPGITITGWNGGSIVRNNSEKNELHALNTTRCARTVRPSADSVTSVRCDWSNNSGNDVSKLDCHAAWNYTKESRKWKSWLRENNWPIKTAVLNIWTCLAPPTPSSDKTISGKCKKAARQRKVGHKLDFLSVARVVAAIAIAV